MNKTGSFAFGGEQVSYSFGFAHADKIPNSVVAVQCPDMPCEAIKLQNDPNSSGNVTIGDAGTLPITGNGWVLTPGSDTDWIHIDNLNLLWHLDAADSTLNYLIIR